MKRTPGQSSRADPAIQRCGNGQYEWSENNYFHENGESVQYSLDPDHHLQTKYEQVRG